MPKSFGLQYDEIKRQNYLRFHVLVGLCNEYNGFSTYGYIGLAPDEIDYEFGHGFETRREAEEFAERVERASWDRENPLAELSCLVVDTNEKENNDA